MTRKTHRSKSHKRRHTRKNGGGCGCAMRGQWGGRGGLGGAEVGHAYTTGASQALYQMNGQTPGLSSGGGKGSKARARTRNAMLAKRAEQRATTLMNKAKKIENKANKLENQANNLENQAEKQLKIATKYRLNAPEFYPESVKLNMALAKKEKELQKMLNENNSSTAINKYNKELNNNFEKIMREVHSGY